MTVCTGVTCSSMYRCDRLYRYDMWQYVQVWQYYRGDRVYRCDMWQCIQVWQYYRGDRVYRCDVTVHTGVTLTVLQGWQGVQGWHVTVYTGVTVLQVWENGCTRCLATQHRVKLRVLDEEHQQINIIILSPFLPHRLLHNKQSLLFFLPHWLLHNKQSLLFYPIFDHWLLHNK